MGTLTKKNDTESCGLMPEKHCGKTKEPLVSVIIATFNRANLVVQAVQSVLGQTYKNIELIVVDDGSTDNTSQVLRKFRNRLVYLYQERAERSAARNLGYRQSKGEYIAFMDSDDLWLPTKIESQVGVLNRNPHVGVVYTGVRFIDGRGRDYAGKICREGLKRRRQSLYEDLMTDNVVGSPSAVMLRRACLERVGLFDEQMNACEDLDLWRRISEHFNFRKIDAPLLEFRIHPDNTQRNLVTMAKGYEMIVSKVAKDTPWKYKYYKNEAIIKLSSKIADLYWHGGKPGAFFGFVSNCLFRRTRYLTKPSFWKDFLRLFLKKITSVNNWMRRWKPSTGVDRSNDD
jgi:glycosyltransferase involved in cell wall biosynthesis